MPNSATFLKTSLVWQISRKKQNCPNFVTIYCVLAILLFVGSPLETKLKNFQIILEYQHPPILIFDS